MLYGDTVDELLKAKEGEHIQFKELQQVLPGHSRSQIQVLMRELCNCGRVFCKGKTSAAKWFLKE